MEVLKPFKNCKTDPKGITIFFLFALIRDDQLMSFFVLKRKRFAVSASIAGQVACFLSAQNTAFEDCENCESMKTVDKENKLIFSYSPF